MTVDGLAQRLARLLTEKALPASSIGQRDRIRLQSLFDAGVLEEIRVGAGRRIILHNTEALEQFIHVNYPAGLEGPVDNNFLPRSLAVAHFRDSKKAARSNSEAIFLRGFGDAALTCGKETLLVAEWTSKAGAAALRLDDKSGWGFSGRIAVVENEEVFFYFERLGLTVDLVILSGGRLSQRVIEWLSSPTMSKCRIIHCGDYDPVGLDEYFRLQAACPGKVALFLPDNLEQLFARFGKRELLEKSTEVLRRLRRHPDPSLQFVVRLMDRYGVGLEQEILLLKQKKD